MTNKEKQHPTDLPLLTDAERYKLLVTWNSTYSNYPKNQCIHQLVEAQVERTPDVVAVVYDDQQITYRQLNQRANQMANYLCSQGVGPEVLVGLCVERSLDMVVGLLGVLKAGGAYVPLDPVYPKDRLAFMLQDAAVPVLLSQRRLVDRIPSHDAKLVYIDTDWSLIAKESADNPIACVKSKNPAYVIYTSGSTGKPKGVILCHEPITNLIWYQVNSSSLPVGTKTLQFASLSFDVSVQEIFSTWCAGGTLQLISEDMRHDISRLPRFLAAQSVKRLFLPAAVFQQLAKAARRDSIYPTDLHEIITAGDQLRITPDIARWLEKLPNSRLHNQYGPTETHVVMTHYVMAGSPAEWPALPPIGRPINNTKIYILDADLQPVPVGVAGEIYIGGICLARGYLNCPDLTAEKFIPNPFDNEVNARLYKSSDLARYLPDGNIEFLGRLDHQVKIRGFRVEPGEVEAQLNQHPAVRQTVVLAPEDEPGHKRLVAYVVATAEQLPTVSELRSFLLKKLPDYMVPSLFMMLDSLPLTPNGKVDRDALPIPSQTRPLLENPFVAPRNDIEQAVVNVWANVLGVKPVGVYDDFFYLGGDSLKATRVLARLEDLFGIQPSYQSFFEEPTVSATAKYINDYDTVSTHRKLPALCRYPRDRALPLSFAQEGIWIASQLKPESAVYNEPFTIHMKDPVDRQALEIAFNELIKRHEILRTAFLKENGRPVQVIKEGICLTLPLMDLQGTGVKDRSNQALHCATKEARRPFDLAKPPLLRASLAQLDDSDYRLYVVLHHIVIDAFGFYEVLVPELWTLYSAFREGKPSPLKPLAVQFADFAQWQRECLCGTVLEKNLAYWKKQLEGAPGLKLPSDRPRPAIGSLDGAFVSLEISRQLTEKLHTLARREGATLYMVLLTAFNVLLWRYTQQDDLIVGTADAGRSRPELEEQLGYFVNLLVIRTKVSNNPTFSQLLEKVRQVTLQAYAHKECPFVKLVQQLQPERNLSRHSLFQVAFVMEPFMPAYESGWSVSQPEVQSGTSKFDLTLEFEERHQGIIGRFEYASDLFDEATIQRLVTHFETLLEGIVTKPESPLSELPLLTSTERHQVLVEWNNTKTDYPKDLCIHQLFEAQATRTPERIAVVCEGQRLSYGELNARANQLAHYLQKQGIGPEVLVGICVQRSLQMVVGLLGILKAGGAYVPLDPAYPAERLAFILSDTQPPVLLTQKRLVDKLPAYAGELICLDSNGSAIDQHSRQNPGNAATCKSLAYVMYTSGSTGRPKGVCVTHRNVVRLVKATNYASLGAEEIFLQFAPISFDASTFELWGPLLNGGRLVVFSAEKPSLAQLGDVIEQHQVTTLWLTAGLFHQMVEDHLDSLRSVRQLLAGGDVLSVPHVKRVLEQLDSCCLINGYGPTENTTFTTYYPMTDVSEVGSSVPIGRPIANTQVYILDPYLHPVPIGLAGELYTGGDGLARGYLNRPELTAEKFILDHFSEDPAGRLYKTGDLARYLPDGGIEFLGRIDHQVKIRGFRIELGEVESVLGRHPAVEEAVVIAREDVPGDKRLVAYVVASHEPTPTFSELRSFLKKKLPDYMIPSAFVYLDSFPITPNGKVDRRALPIPDARRPDIEESFAAPRNAVEEALAEIWAEILRIEKVGIQDNFFELGGHSLMATQLISRLSDVFQVEITLRQLFLYPTIVQLALIISEKLEKTELEYVKQLLDEFEDLSDEEAERLLAQELRKNDRADRSDKHWTDKSKGMNNLADSIARLSPAKKALIELRLKKKGLVVSGEQCIPQRKKLSSAPLSFAQQRLWFLNQLGTSSAYNIPLAIRLKGLPNIKAMEESFNEIIRRHEALRTTFRSAGGHPIQVIAENISFKMPLIDLSGQPKAEREVEAERLTRDEAMRRFDLAKGPLFNAALIRLSEEEHILLLTMHHIVSDGWSMGVFTDELSALYKAFCNGEASPLPKPPIQYADFAQWQREWLQGEVLENQLSYWRKQLEGVPVLQLRTDRPRPSVQTFGGASQNIALSPKLTGALNDLSQRQGVTLFMTLLAAFQTLLFRYTGQEDIVVGSPIANRNRVEIEGLIGFFVNSLAMRTDLSGNPTFRELLGRVRETALGAHEHQDLPFEKLVQELNPERNMSHTPLFQVMFNMINVKDIAVKLHNLTVERLPSVESESKFDITLYVTEIASCIELHIVYNTDLFDSWRMAEMLKQYQVLLESIVSDSDQRISELSLLTEAERHQILVDWNDTAADYPADKCIHTLFEAQAEHSPEAVAVIFGDEQLSYHELNCRANQLAHYLRKHGVDSEEVVGICMERSLEMIVGLLAILKAGGAYVALEPDFPGARLSFMLEDTKLGLLLTQERLLEKIPEYSGKVVCLDRDCKMFQNEQESNLELITAPEDLVYVTYTSGSTGKPKGILTSHRSVVQNLHALIHNYSLSATDIVLQLPSFSFDASVRDIFGPLLAGARIVVVRNDEANDPSALVAKIAENHVTCILSIVPSQLTQLVEAGSHNSFSFAALRHISAAGEPLPMALCKRVQNVFGCSVVNQYGPTECTMISSYHRVVDLDGNRNIALIGRPIENTQFYILDDHLNPVPVGVAGEAYIGGLGVSNGYLNLPDLTAEKFIPNPFSNEPESRLYKTGDIVCFLPDGTMEFLGRRDFQVKLRGVRIELGEVEATLCLHPSVSEAVVVAREDRPGDKRLVAYVVAAAAESVPSTGVLRAFLQEKLPDYMIPSAFVFLDALPLTANSKVNRQMLPSSDQLRPDLRIEYVAPRTPIEQLLAEIWSDVLGIEKVGIYDNFFELGGHSLLAIQVILRVCDALQLDLPLRLLFESQALSDMAIAILKKYASRIEQEKLNQILSDLEQS